MYICGIHTDAGKSHLGVALCKAFGFSYFKLIQAGKERDADIIKKYSSNTKIYDDGMFLYTPASPHFAMKNDEIYYSMDDIKVPNDNNLIIELAGGIYCPIDENNTMLDFMKKNKKDVILASRYYLGSINHTILTIKALQENGLNIVCVVMIGEIIPSTDEFIKEYTNVNLAHLEYFNENNIEEKIKKFKKEIEKYLH
ncbi:ATP-dependent dethiobiotin synthetase BioD [Campylobacter sp. MG1]|uniref:ATP-dependent dethiobiotin synthetase BioD n=1 Tax=Campylobacter sp. MG1 TaxID=2976332 RepID=UPI00226CEEE6|nr:dethiobiotin synthase [Campylobacter sp. MG1]